MKSHSQPMRVMKFATLEDIKNVFFEIYETSLSQTNTTTILPIEKVVYFTTRQAALMLDVTTQTLHNYKKKGVLIPEGENAECYSLRQLENFLTNRQLNEYSTIKSRHQINQSETL